MISKERKTIKKKKEEKGGKERKKERKKKGERKRESKKERKNKKKRITKGRQGHRYAPRGYAPGRKGPLEPTLALKIGYALVLRWVQNSGETNQTRCQVLNTKKEKRKERKTERKKAVSYTHLTLPTICSV